MWNSRLPPLALLGLAACGEERYDLDGGDRVTAGERVVAERGCGSWQEVPRPATPGGRHASCRPPREVPHLELAADELGTCGGACP